MSAAIDSHGRKTILMIAANPGISPTTGWPVGFWWAELTHPWWAFTEAGYEVRIVSPAGGDLVADSFSDPEDASGYSAHDLISLGFKKSPAHAGLLAGTAALTQADIDAADAIFVVGGQSPMITMVNDDRLAGLVAHAFEAGKVVCLVCHATCLLLKVRLADGRLLAEGRSWTGFANSEEEFADSFVGKRIQPFWIEEEAGKIAGTNFIVSGRFKPFAIRDGNLVTGQQQYSGGEAARLVIEALGR